MHPAVSLERAIKKFSGATVLVPLGMNGHENLHDYVRECLKYFNSDTRFVFIISTKSLESAKSLHGELRRIIERR